MLEYVDNLIALYNIEWWLNRGLICIIIAQLNRIFGRGGSTLTRAYCCNMFHCCCVKDCSSTSNRERHLSFLAHSPKNKTLLKCWVDVIRQTNLLLNRHPQICSKHFVNVEGRRLYLDEVQPSFLARPFKSSINKRRKPAKYRSASLGDEPSTIVVTIVRSWSKRLFICASPEGPKIVSPCPPTSPGLSGW